MSSIIGWSLSFRTLVVGLAAGLVVLGGLQLQNAPVDVLPEYTVPYVEIQTEALGLSAAEVEQFVTVPMEALMLNGVAFVDTVRSESVPGLSSIVLLFEPGTDLYRARQLVQERMSHANLLPNVSKPPQMIQPLSSASRVMIVSLASSVMTPTDLSVLARWTIRPRLMGVEGVANVAIWGHRERQLQVLVDPERLHGRGVTLDQVISTTGNALWVSPLSYLRASTPGAGGFIDTPNQRLGIRHVLPIRTPDDLSRVPIDGHPTLRIGDVADVVEDHQPMIGDASTAEGQSLMLIIEKLPGEHALSVTRKVESALAAMQTGLPGVSVDTTVYREATFVESAMANLGLVMLIALLLIAAVVGAFLQEWRAVVIAIVAIAISILAAALVLYLLGRKPQRARGRRSRGCPGRHRRRRDRRRRPCAPAPARADERRIPCAFGRRAPRRIHGGPWSLGFGHGGRPARPGAGARPGRHRRCVPRALCAGVHRRHARVPRGRVDRHSGTRHAAPDEARPSNGRSRVSSGPSRRGTNARCRERSRGRRPRTSPWP